MSNSKKHQVWCKISNKAVVISNNTELSQHLVRLMKNHYKTNGCKMISRDLNVNYYLVRNWLQKGVTLDAYHLFAFLQQYDFVRESLGFRILDQEKYFIVKESVKENMQKVLDLLVKKPTMTLKDMQMELNLSRRQVEYIINRLKNDKKIIRKGSTKKGNWIVL